MNRSELEHVVRAAAGTTNEKEFIIIGSQSILGKYPDAPKDLRYSFELDIYPKNRPEMSELIDGAIGERSTFHLTFKYYAHGIGPGTAILPPEWETRLVKVCNENTNGAIAWCLDPHDLAYSKLAAGRPKDIEFIKALLKHHLIRQSELQRLITGTQNEELKQILQGHWNSVQS